MFGQNLRQMFSELWVWLIVVDGIILNFFSKKALEKAKEAGRKERALCRQREQSSLGEQVNLDMTYSVSTLS